MTALPHLKYNNLSVLLDRLAPLATSDKELGLLASLRDIHKQARWAQHQDFRYDVLQILNLNYDVMRDRNNSAFSKAFIDSIVPHEEYDPTREW